MSLVLYSPQEVNGSHTLPEGTTAKRRRLDANKLDYVITSEIDEEQFSFEWTLSGYSLLCNSFPEIRSPILVGGPKSKHSWQLKIIPKKMIDEKEYTSVYVILINFGDGKDFPTRKVRARFQLRFLSADGHALIQVGDSVMREVDFKKFSEWGWKDVMLSKDTEKVTVDDSLKISLRMWLDGQLKHEVTNNLDIHRELAVPKMHETGALLLASHLSTLLNDPESADVTIKTKLDGKNVMAHKIFLIARSPVFAKMFSTSMRESKENSVVIKDFESEVVLGMLEWMYTGQTRLLLKQAPDLLQIAEKYDLKGLKRDCESTLVRKLRVENAAKMLVLGHLHHAPYLKRRAMEFTISKMDQVVETAGFKEVAEQFNYTGIFVELFMQIANSKM